MVKVLKSSSGKPLHYSKPIVEIKYGALYNWYAASKNGGTGAGSIAPVGWHVPSDVEYAALKTYLSTNQTGKLKEIGTIFWTAPNSDATNETEFNLRGSGCVDGASGLFGFINDYCYLWTSVSGKSIRLTYSGFWFEQTGTNKQGMSIRLIKNTSDWSEGETVTDIDGNIYPTTKIGDQVWMAANLAVTKYNDGTPISNVTDNAAWAALTTDAYCWYSNDINNGFTVTGSTKKILRTALPVPAPQGLELTFDSITNVPVADASSVSDWNTFFDLPNNGGVFTSVEVVGDMVRLMGGDLVNLYFNSLSIISINNLDSFSNLEIFSLYDLPLLETLPDISNLNRLLNYSIYSIPLVTEIPDFSLDGTLYSIQLTDLAQVSSLPNISSLISLQNLEIYGIPLLSELPDLVLLVNLSNLVISFNDLITSSDFDQILTTYSIEYSTLSVCTLTSYLGNQPPTPSILAAAQAANPQCTFITD